MRNGLMAVIGGLPLFVIPGRAEHEPGIR